MNNKINYKKNTYNRNMIYNFLELSYNLLINFIKKIKKNKKKIQYNLLKNHPK